MSANTLVLGDTLIDAGSIQRRVIELAAEIDACYRITDDPVLLVCVLKGSLVFSADLLRALTVPVDLDCIQLASYGPRTSSAGRVEVVRDLSTAVDDRDVLLVEDIVDTGVTAAFLRRHLSGRPRSVRLVALLDKVARREVDVAVDWRGFAIPDSFVVGYGLDLGERYRGLPDVHLLVPG